MPTHPFTTQQPTTKHPPPTTHRDLCARFRLAADWHGISVGPCDRICMLGVLLGSCWLGGELCVAAAYLLHGTFITSLPVRKWVGGCLAGHSGSVIQRLGGWCCLTNQYQQAENGSQTRCPDGYVVTENACCVAVFSCKFSCTRWCEYRLENILYHTVEDLKSIFKSNLYQISN